jgi:hypothetical protein
MLLGQTSSQDPSGYPSDNFDLTNWSLQLPVNSHGGPSGAAAEVTDLSGYTNPNYFHTGTDGAMVFVAPVIGARTSGSHYTRSELREMSGSRKAAWTIGQGGTMEAELSVERVPVTSDGAPGRIVIGQVHGQSQELCRLYFDKNTVYFVDDHAGPDSAPVEFHLYDPQGREPDISIGEKFDYSIQVGNKGLTVDVVADHTLYKAFDPISHVWDSDRFYFKAGVYNGVGAPGSGASTLGSGVGVAAFYFLAATHP